MIPRIACAVSACFLCLPSDALAEDVVDFAASLVGRPYVWGAEGPDAFDCSGLTQYVYQEFGIDLPRRAISQSRVGDSTGRRLQRGDLLFFASDSRRSTVTHVGLYEGNGVMIDASKSQGRVGRDDLNDPYWAERFMFARRVGPWIASAERRDRDRDAAEPDAPLPRTSSGRRKAVRVLERVAETLFIELSRRR